MILGVLYNMGGGNVVKGEGNRVFETMFVRKKEDQWKSSQFLVRFDDKCQNCIIFLIFVKGNIIAGRNFCVIHLFEN